MLIRSFIAPVLCSALLTLAACDKEETLGEVESETAVNPESDSESDSASESESDSGDTEGDSDSGVSCPTDAMICPDGTAVGRSGPKCEFAPCPGGTDSDSDTGDEPPPEACPEGLTYQEPAGCPSEGDGTPYIIDPGCYADCDPAEPACGDGEVCMTLETNPCICDDSDPDGEGPACCDACSAGSALCVPVVTGDACDAVPANYLSIEEYECGITPDSLEMCQWQVNLQATGEYLWMHSDVGEGGNYACIDGVITLDNDPTHSASYDPDTGILTWDGIEYTQAG